MNIYFAVWWNRDGKRLPSPKNPPSYKTMSQKYKLIERRNLGADNEENPRKFYAQAINSGYVSFDELCEEIAESCTLTSADVKAVIFAIGSTGSITEKEFNASQIKTPKIVFTPGSKLKDTRKLTTFEKASELPETGGSEEEEGGSPGGV